MREPAEKTRHLDRMDDPLSYTAAVVGGGASIILVGCTVLAISDPLLFRSTVWWSWTVLAIALLSMCVIGYMRPRSRLNYLPVGIAGIVLFGCCLLALRRYLAPDSDVSFSMAWFVQSSVLSCGLDGLSIPFSDFAANRKLDNLHACEPCKNHLSSA